MILAWRRDAITRTCAPGDPQLLTLPPDPKPRIATEVVVAAACAPPLEVEVAAACSPPPVAPLGTPLAPSLGPPLGRPPRCSLGTPAAPPSPTLSVREDR